jgi:hypothetical protein
MTLVFATGQATNRGLPFGNIEAGLSVDAHCVVLEVPHKAGSVVVLAHEPVWKEGGVWTGGGV